MTLTATKCKGYVASCCLVTLALSVTVGGSVGCSRSKPTPGASVKATPSPTPTPRPQQAVRAQAVDVHFTMTDVKGVTVAAVNAKTTSYDPLSNGGTVTAENADAILYEDGKPATRIRARKVSANRDTRVVTATGDVRAESLSDKAAPKVRSERMVWKADSKILTGDGRVLLTAKPDFELPGRSFRADTKLNQVNVIQDERVGQGSL